LIYLDTHVVVWLYAGLTEPFSAQARNLINEHDLLISPIVRLELQYLYEIGRITVPSDAIIEDLGQRIGLDVCSLPFEKVVGRALAYAWTRDPFDRLIVAQAETGGGLLLTKDRAILQNAPHAVW